FFDRLKQMHTQTLSNDYTDNLKKYSRNELNINKELETLKNISDTLFNKTPFGLSLQEMYAESYNIGKDTKDYLFYKAMLSTNIINKNYAQLDEDLKFIKDKNLPSVFIRKLELVQQNPMVEHIRNDLDMHKLKEAY